MGNGPKYNNIYRHSIILFQVRVSLKGGFLGATSGCVLYADATYTRVYTVLRAIERIAFLLLISQYPQLHLTTLSKLFLNVYIYINCVELYLLIIYFQILNIKTNFIMVYYILYTCIYIIICTCGVAWLVYAYIVYVKCVHGISVYIVLMIVCQGREQRRVPPTLKQCFVMF